jgi:hypothetical protein
VISCATAIAAQGDHAHRTPSGRSSSATSDVVLKEVEESATFESVVENVRSGERGISDGGTLASARRLILSDDWEQAEALLASAIASDPDNPELHLLFAEIHFYYYKDLGRTSSLREVALHAARSLDLDFAAARVDLCRWSG